jgi:ribosomal protein L30
VSGYFRVRQIRSPIRRHHSQRKTLQGLGLNKIGRIATVPFNGSIWGMVHKVRHLIDFPDQELPWRPVNAYDDGRKVFIEFSPGIAQGEMPPLFVIGQDGKPELVNYRVYKNVLIVDRLFAAAELRLGGEKQQKVRIVRDDGQRS